jgi:hypothetical protein
MQDTADTPHPPSLGKARRVHDAQLCTHCTERDATLVVTGTIHTSSCARLRSIRLCNVYVHNPQQDGPVGQRLMSE